MTESREERRYRQEKERLRRLLDARQRAAERAEGRLEESERRGRKGDLVRESGEARLQRRRAAVSDALRKLASYQKR